MYTAGSSERPSASRNTLTPFVQSHQRDRDGIVADRKDDREMALSEAELIDGHRNCMGLADLRRFLDRADLHLAVLGDVQGLDRVIEKRQTDVRRCGRHAVILLGSGGSDFANASPAVKLWALASIGLGRFLQAAHNSLIVQRIAAKPGAHKRASSDSDIFHQLRSVAARPVRGRARGDSDRRSRAWLSRTK